MRLCQTNKKITHDVLQMKSCVKKSVLLVENPCADASAHNSGFAESVYHKLRGLLRNVKCGIFVAYLNSAYAASGKTGFVSHGADDVSGLDTGGRAKVYVYFDHVAVAVAKASAFSDVAEFSAVAAAFGVTAAFALVTCEGEIVRFRWH